MIPISLLYGTPDDAAAQMEYLKKRGYPISYVGMGEEPDDQDMLPEDYAELYLQFATAMHKVDPNLKLGGPVFEGVNEDIKVWPDAQGRTSWFGRFLDYLKARNRISDLAFMSFEHYPYPPCEIVRADLFREPQLVSHILDVWRQDGLPANVPMMNTESNVTYGNAQQMADIFAVLCRRQRRSFSDRRRSGLLSFPDTTRTPASGMPRLRHLWKLCRRRETQRKDLHIPIPRQPPDQPRVGATSGRSPQALSGSLRSSGRCRPHAHHRLFR